MADKRIGRRVLLTGGAAGLLAGAASCAPSKRPIRPLPPEAPHQPGIVTTPPAAVFAAFDIRVPDRDALAGLLRLIGTQITGARAEILVSELPRRSMISRRMRHRLDVRNYS